MATETSPIMTSGSTPPLPPETLYQIIARVVVADIDRLALAAQSLTSANLPSTLVRGLPNTHSLLSVSKQFSDITLKVVQDALHVSGSGNASGFDGDECRGHLNRAIIVLSALPSSVGLRSRPPPGHSETPESITMLESPLLQAYTLSSMALRVVMDQTPAIGPEGQSRSISEAAEFYTAMALSAAQQIRPAVLREPLQKAMQQLSLTLDHVLQFHEKIAELEASKRRERRSIKKLLNEVQTYKLLEEMRAIDAHPFMGYYNGPMLPKYTSFDKDALEILERYDSENGEFSPEVMDAMLKLSEGFQAGFRG